MDHSFLRGLLGCAVTAPLAGAAYNLKLRLREIKALIFVCSGRLSGSLGRLKQ